MKKARIATYLANILDHFDTSLYGFLVPILAPLFLNGKSLLDRFQDKDTLC